MDLSNLKPAKGSTKIKKRLGRGEGSGAGDTASRGHKGAQSRSGYSRKIGFEGGQMPLQRRLPKFGFKNVNRKDYKAINVGILQTLSEKKGTDTLDVNLLIEAGLVSSSDKVKILGNGSLTSKLNVSAHAFSGKAKELIEAIGGKAEVIK